MTTTLPAFTPLENSLWLTLCARALDNRSPQPILGDAAADQIVRTLDYDYAKLNIDTNLRLSVALRDAVGLDLGAGLDTRAARLNVPDTVDWYDVDFPAVAAARESVVPAHPRGHIIGADVRDPGWLDAVPNDRPAVITADGLMGFLTEDEMVTLWNRLIDHFPSGELVFNGYTRFAVWVARHAPGSKSVAEMIKFPGMDDPREPESWNPQLRLVREIVLSREPEVDEFPQGWRQAHRLIAHSTTLSRMASLVLHYRF
jgi:O-methyltransferase involved in polyketide biosynthesis